jgi:Protein of unknown function (DUF4058)
MPSPFPGMDPYLEDHWRDLHARLIIYICDALQEGLPTSLRARVEERFVLELPEGLFDEGRFPDVRVVEYRPDGARPRQADGPAVAEPIVLEAETEPLTEPYIEIIDVGSGNKVVTVLEVLSPTNKTPGVGMIAYRREQREVCHSDTSLVEIDLLRGGQHVLAVLLNRIPAEHRTPYMACVRRAWVKGLAEVYPMPLSQPLPRIKVPLRESDTDAVLYLQPLLEQCYRRGGYDGTIDYKKDPGLAFSESEGRWADQLLREAGLRAAPPGKGKRRRPPKPPGDG